MVTYRGIELEIVQDKQRMWQQLEEYYRIRLRQVRAASNLPALSKEDEDTVVTCICGEYLLSSLVFSNYNLASDCFDSEEPDRTNIAWNKRELDRAVIILEYELKGAK